MSLTSSSPETLVDRCRSCLSSSGSSSMTWKSQWSSCSGSGGGRACSCGGGYLVSGVVSGVCRSQCSSISSSSPHSERWSYAMGHTSMPPAALRILMLRCLEPAAILLLERSCLDWSAPSSRPGYRRARLGLGTAGGGTGGSSPICFSSMSLSRLTMSFMLRFLRCAKPPMASGGLSGSSPSSIISSAVAALMLGVGADACRCLGRPVRKLWAYSSGIWKLRERKRGTFSPLMNSSVVRLLTAK
mmetsp:Transcript_8170/g.24251  ORF Transcript_8170/g.24251 Transcript_8170/m.24251 type:complete len:244 (-) Transcript_8170:794-1525(-)